MSTRPRSVLLNLTGLFLVSVVYLALTMHPLAGLACLVTGAASCVALAHSLLSR